MSGVEGPPRERTCPVWPDWSGPASALGGAGAAIEMNFTFEWSLSPNSLNAVTATK